MSSYIEQKLIEFTESRFVQSNNKRLFDVYHSNEEMVSPDESFISFCFQNKKEIIDVLADAQFQCKLIELCCKNVIAFNTKSNQFLNIPNDLDESLKAIYLSLINDISEILSSSATKEILRRTYKLILRNHLGKFKSLIESNISDSEESKALFFTEKVCSEYSPELQINILGIDLNELKDPIIDLGCGTNALLVEYLREKGFKAIGVDRIVKPKPYLFPYSWDEFPFPSSFFGTVISHMAFTNHFVFQHNSSTAEPEKYARIFMKVLHALRKGGKFIYAPGVPFFEEYLPIDEYFISSFPIIVPTDIETHLGNKFEASSVQIERMM